MCIKAESTVNRMLPDIEKDQGKQKRRNQVSSFNLGLKKKKKEFWWEREGRQKRVFQAR